MSSTRPNDSYTHGHHHSVLAVHSWRTARNSAAYLLPHLRSGQSLLDVGCGPGTITTDLATYVAPGRVVGLDRSKTVVSTARESAKDPSVEFVAGDVYALDFADGSFDVVHAHQLLQHLSDPVAALREMARVAKPGGLLAVRDVDFGTAVSYPDLTDQWLSIYLEMARRAGAEPNAGRHLKAWAHRAGLTVVRCSATAWCFASTEERQWWGGSYAQRVVEADYARAAVEQGVSTAERNEQVAAAWRAWVEHPDGFVSLTHGEILARP